MELPHLGKHCSEKTCRQLDFLPMKCDACSEIFCTEHLQYDHHSCTSSYKKNIQVPVCPLCNQPIPVPRGTVPDLAVSEHIENNCQVRSKKAVFSNRCNKAKCKKKELVPIVCDTCRLNFCLTHRHPTDHDCQGPQTTSRAAAAATARAEQSTGGPNKMKNFFSGPFRQPQPVSSVSRPSQPRAAPSSAAAAALNRQAGRGSTPGRPLVARTENGGLSEDEALAAALAASLSSPGQAEAEDEDRQLALALQESERQAAARRGQTAGGPPGDGDKSCSVQ